MVMCNPTTASTAMEVRSSPDGALVLVDRAPCAPDPNRSEGMPYGASGTVGTDLKLQGAIEELEGGISHGFYTGSLGNIPSVLDQFVLRLKGEPVMIIHVIRRIPPPGILSRYTDIDFIRSFILNA